MASPQSQKPLLAIHMCVMGTCCSGGWSKLLPPEAEDSPLRNPLRAGSVSLSGLGGGCCIVGKGLTRSDWVLFLRPLLQALWPWASHLLSLGIRFPICKMGMMQPGCLPPGMIWLDDSESSSKLQSHGSIWGVINIFSCFHSRPSLRRRCNVFEHGANS